MKTYISDKYRFYHKGYDILFYNNEFVYPIRLPRPFYMKSDYFGKGLKFTKKLTNQTELYLSLKDRLQTKTQKWLLRVYKRSVLQSFAKVLSAPVE